MLSLFFLSSMFNLADFIVHNVPLPKFPPYLISYERGVTPLSTWPPVILVLAVYLLVVFGLRELRRSQPPLKLTFLFQLHNLMLSTGSGLLLILMCEEIFPIWWKYGLFRAMCNEKSWTDVSSVNLYWLYFLANRFMSISGSKSIT